MRLGMARLRIAKDGVDTACPALTHPAGGWGEVGRGGDVGRGGADSGWTRGERAAGQRDVRTGQALGSAAS